MRSVLAELKKQLVAAGTKKKSKKKCMRKFDSKEEYFITNGGLLFEKKITMSQGKEIGAGQLKIISQEDIRKATNNYDTNLIFGSLRGKTIFKGTLDERTVAIATPQDWLTPNPELIDRFLTAVSVAMVLYNITTVTPYGCCLETYIPMPVYEFLPHVELYEYLHGQSVHRRPMKWTHRLRVATEVGYTLCYMHNALSKPVVHRDVMSRGIIIDSKSNAKLVNFGYAVCITPGKKDQIWPLHGTPGYIDPEYIETKQVSEKCDVYSFGVLMLELLTKKDPSIMASSTMGLVDAFSYAMARNCVKEMIDTVVLESGNMIELECFARLALRCVAMKGVDRLTMIEVVNELRLKQDQGNQRSGGCA